MFEEREREPLKAVYIQSANQNAALTEALACALVTCGVLTGVGWWYSGEDGGVGGVKGWVVAVAWTARVRVTMS